MDCPICLEDIDEVFTSNCKHSFCIKCIKKLCEFSEQGNRITWKYLVPCPMCRRDIYIDMIFKQKYIRAKRTLPQQLDQQRIAPSPPQSILSNAEWRNISSALLN